MLEIAEIISGISKGGLIGEGINWLFGLIFLLMIIIELLPIIKLRPISSILKWIGNIVNKDVITEVNTLRSAMDEYQKKNSERYAITCRTRILAFGDEIRRGSKHSKESFDQVLEDIDTYEKYCRDNPDFKNNKTRLTTKKILEVYAECLNQDDFL